MNLSHSTKTISNFWCHKFSPGACLGIPNEGEMCAEVITPGFNVTVQVSETQYVYRVNDSGTVVRRVK